MKRLLILSVMLTMLLTAFSQNGGQSPENSSVKLQFAGFSQTKLFNKQTCEAIIQVKYNSTTTNYTVPANGSILISTPVPGKITAKTTTNCGAADFGLVELNITATLLPVKFVSFKAVPIGDNSMRVTFEVAEASNVKHYNVQLSKDGITWQTVSVVLHDELQPNRVYTVDVKLNTK